MEVSIRSFVESLQQSAADLKTTILLFLSLLNKLVFSIEDISQMISWSESLKSDQRQSVEDASAMMAKVNVRMGQKPSTDNRVQVNLCAYLQQKLYPVTESVIALNTIVGQLKDMDESFTVVGGNLLMARLHSIVLETSVRHKEVENIVDSLASLVDRLGYLPDTSNDLGKDQQSLSSCSTSSNESTKESLKNSPSVSLNSEPSPSVVIENLVKQEREDGTKANIFKLKGKIEKKKNEIVNMELTAEMADLKLEEEKIEMRAQVTILKALQSRIILPKHLSLDFVSPPTSPC